MSYRYARLIRQESHSSSPVHTGILPRPQTRQSRQVHHLRDSFSTLHSREIEKHYGAQSRSKIVKRSFHDTSRKCDLKDEDHDNARIQSIPFRVKKSSVEKPRLRLSTQLKLKHKQAQDEPSNTSDTVSKSGSSIAGSDKKKALQKHTAQSTSAYTKSKISDTKGTRTRTTNGKPRTGDLKSIENGDKVRQVNPKTFTVGTVKIIKLRGKETSTNNGLDNDSVSPSIINTTSNDPKSSSNSNHEENRLPARPSLDKILCSYPTSPTSRLTVEQEEDVLRKCLEDLSYDELNEASYNRYNRVGRDHDDNTQAIIQTLESDSRDWQDNMKNMALLFREEKGKEVDDTPDKFKYRSLAIPLTAAEHKQGLPIPWTIPTIEKSQMTGMQLLNAEISRFSDHIWPTTKEREVRNAVHDLVLSMLKTSLRSQYVYQSMGSWSTHLDFPTSDIDFNVQLRPSDAFPDKSIMQLIQPEKLHTTTDESTARLVQPKRSDSTIASALLIIEKNLEHNPDFIVSLTRIQDTGISLVCAKHKQTDIEVQFAAAGKLKTLQPKGGTPVQQRLPHFQAIYAVIRTSILYRGLLDSYTGGLGSYTLQHMIIASLTRRGLDLATLPTAADQLLHVLRFWATFDNMAYGLVLGHDGISRPFRKHNMSVRMTRLLHGAAYRRGNIRRAWQHQLGAKKDHRTSFVCLQDLARDHNDLGYGFVASMHLKETFRYLYAKLHSGMLDFESSPERRTSLESLLEPVVGRVHEIQHEKRARIESFDPGTIYMERKPETPISYAKYLQHTQQKTHHSSPQGQKLDKSMISKNSRPKTNPRKVPTNTQSPPSTT